MNKLNKRSGMDFDVDFKTSENESEKVIQGYFVKFDDKYPIGNGIYETIDRHAFDDALNDDITMLWNHDDNYPLARTSNGTLKIKVDDVGLWAEAKINQNDKFASDAYERVKRKEVYQGSFLFSSLDEQTIHHGKEVEFNIRKVKLYEISPVTFPAYKETSISARKLEVEEMRKKQLQAKKEIIKERIGNIVKTVKAE